MRDVILLTEGPSPGKPWMTRWFCEVPATGAGFFVLRSEWCERRWLGDELIPCRDIYEIRLAKEVTGDERGT